jgi:hypothetical protein
MLRDNYHVILEELASDDFPLVPIEQLDEGNAYLNEDNQWRALYFIINGYPTKISKKFPRVSEYTSDHAMPSSSPSSSPPSSSCALAPSSLAYTLTHALAPAVPLSHLHQF